MIKIVFNFKLSIRIHVLHALFFIYIIISLIIYIFIIKILFNFKCIHVCMELHAS